MTAGRWWGVLRLALGLALLVIVVARTGATRLVPQLRSAPWLLPLFAFQALLGLLTEAQRLRLLLRSQQVALPFTRALRFCLTAVPFSYVVPGGVGGDVMKIASLAGERTGRGVELAAVVLVDRITGLVSLLLVALAAALLSDSFATAPAPLRAAALAAALGLAAAAAGLLLAWSPMVRATGVYRFVTLRAPWHRVAARGLDALYAFRDHKDALAGALAMTMAGHTLLVGFFVLGASVVMAAVPAGTVGWVALLSLVANVLPLTPGGLGVGEAAFAAAFQAMGYGGGAQLLLLMRLGVVPFACLGGVLYILGDRRRAGTPRHPGDADRE